MTVRCCIYVSSSGAASVGQNHIVVDVPVETTGASNPADVVERVRESMGAFYAHEVVR